MSFWESFRFWLADKLAHAVVEGMFLGAILAVAFAFVGYQAWRDRRRKGAKKCS